MVRDLVEVRLDVRVMIRVMVRVMVGVMVRDMVRVRCMVRFRVRAWVMAWVRGMFEVRVRVSVGVMAEVYNLGDITLIFRLFPTLYHNPDPKSLMSPVVTSMASFRKTYTGLIYYRRCISCAVLLRK